MSTLSRAAQLKTALLVARRFIFAAKKVRMINIITALSILGVIVGTATIVIVLSVMNGFRDLAYNLFLAIDTEVRLIPKQGATMTMSDSLLLQLRQIEGVASARPFVEGKVLLITPKQSGVVMLKGIEPEAYQELAPYLDEHRRFLEENHIILGLPLAYRFSAMYNTDVRVLSTKQIDEGLAALQNPLLRSAITLPVLRVGNFFSAHRLYDDVYALTARRTAQSVFGYTPEVVTGIELRAKSGVSDEALKARLESWLRQQGLSEQFAAESLSDRFLELFRVMKLEKWGSFIILLLIVVVAATSLIGSLTMTAIEKRRDLYFLACMGLAPQSLRHLFIFEGLLIGVIGTVSGTLFGFLVCFAQKKFELVPLPSAESFIIRAYPVSMIATDFVAVVAATLVIVFLASLYPAHRAALLAKVQPDKLRT
ncbi:MAG: ABC transporter permease [Chloroherpetonaceae bacterium]|nr:ABC transporter permease [Chloroherpetonaceae bacterium]